LLLKNLWQSADAVEIQKSIEEAEETFIFIWFWPGADLAIRM
jgi:hypothetical protein